MTLLLLATLALGGIGLNIVRHVLTAAGETCDDWDADHDPALTGRLVYVLHDEAERLADRDGAQP